MNRVVSEPSCARLFWAGILLATLVGFGLRTHGIWKNDFWTDELIAIRSSHTLEGIADHCFQRYTSPPFRYLLTWFFLNYPHEERLIRIPSLLAGSLAILVTGLLASKWFGLWAGFWSAWAMALNPWAIAYSQDGRMHIVAMFFFLASLACVLPPKDPNRLWPYLAGGIGLAFSSAITYAAVIVCFGGVCVVSLEILRQKQEGLLRRMLGYSLPWTVWMVAWLSLVWAMTQPNGPPPPKIGVQVESENTDTPAAPLPTETPPRPKKVMPLLNPQFYRESIASTWNDQPLKLLFILGAFGFVVGRGTQGSPSRLSRLLLFAIPIGLILILHPLQFYRRYLLSLLPFPLMGIGLLGSFFSRRIWQSLVFGLVLLVLTVPPALWVLDHSPQPWQKTRDYLKEHLNPNDQLLMGTHQAEFAASYYMVGKVPTWKIVYNGMFLNRFVEIPKQEGTCWFVQWYGMPPSLEKRFLEIYDKVAVYPGRFGEIVIFREKEHPAQKSSQ